MSSEVERNVNLIDLLQGLSDSYLVAKHGFDTAENHSILPSDNEYSKICQELVVQ